MSKKIKFAVAGCGHIGLRHAEMIRLNPEAELVALADIKPKSQLAIPENDETPFFHSLEELIAAGLEIDVLNIATPNGYHAAQALQALEHGMHVVIEKPMALHRADAEAIIRKSKEKNRQVFVVMQNRYSPPSQWLKELVDSGSLGEIYMVQLNCFWNRDSRYYTPDSWHGKKALDGGTLFTQFSHFVDMMYWLFGDITDIQARLKNYNHTQMTEFEDSGLVHFSFVKGGTGTINYSTSVWDRNMESSMTIIAEKGSVKIGGQYMNHVEYCHVQDYCMPELEATNPGNDYGQYKGSAQNHHYVIRNVIDVLHQRAGITTNAEEGMKVVEMIERIYRAGI
jgi:UDP-N-acetyl-2-amino-2-deoxyglucuronate dehydrogenase